MKKYPLGVDFHPSPLFNLVENPWDCINALHKRMVIAHQLERFLRFDKVAMELKTLDLACFYGEQYTLISRMRKARGCSFNYVGIDIDDRKLEVARKINPGATFIEHDLNNLENLDLSGFNSLVCTDIPESMDFDSGISMINSAMNFLVTGGVASIGFYTIYNGGRQNSGGWTIKNVRLELEKSGFSILSSFYLDAAKTDTSPLFSERKLDRIPYQIAKGVITPVMTDLVGPHAVICIRK